MEPRHPIKEKFGGWVIEKEEILKAIFRAVEEVNKKLPRERRIEKSPETPWLGPRSKLDSMGLVFLIVAVEKEIKRAFGVGIKIANENIVFSEKSPLQNANRLANHIFSLLSQNKIKS